MSDHDPYVLNPTGSIQLASAIPNTRKPVRLDDLTIGQCEVMILELQALACDLKLQMVLDA